LTARWPADIACFGFRYDFNQLDISSAECGACLCVSQLRHGPLMLSVLAFGVMALPKRGPCLRLAHPRDGPLLLPVLALAMWLE
jgi:hypothetical protein